MNKYIEDKKNISEKLALKKMLFQASFQKPVKFTKKIYLTNRQTSFSPNKKKAKN